MLLMNTLPFWWGFFLLAAPVEDAELQVFVKQCERGAYRTCAQTGLNWIQHHELTKPQKRVVLTYLSRAYMFLGRKDVARDAMKRLVELEPCLREIPGLRGQMRVFFHNVRSEVLKSDTGPPILSHTPVTYEDLSKPKPIIEAKVTDEMKVMDVMLFYRTRPSGMYRQVTMKQEEGSRYVASIPKKALQGVKVFEYFIRARDCALRVARTGGPPSPTKVVLEGKGSGGRQVLGSIFTSLGVVMVVGGGVSFYASAIEFEKIRKLNDSPSVTTARERFTMYQILGWSGTILGAGATVFGAYLLLTKEPKKKPVTSAFRLPPNRSAKETFCSVQ